MQIKAYLEEIFQQLDDNPYIESRNLTVEEYSPNAAYIKIAVSFLDGSKLHFKEFFCMRELTYDKLAKER